MQANRPPTPEYRTSAALTTCKNMNTVRLLSALTSDSEIKKGRASGLSLSRRELCITISSFPSRSVQCSADTTRAQKSTKALCRVQSQPTRLPQLCRIHAEPWTAAAVRASLPCSEALKHWACHNAVLTYLHRIIGVEFGKEASQHLWQLGSRLLICQLNFNVGIGHCENLSASNSRPSRGAQN